jgi:TusA-related sulfurtransferase
MRELIIKWLREAMQLSSGEELFIPADSKTAQDDMYSYMRKELNILKNIEPEEAVKLRISTTFRDKGFWVVIKKISVTPLVAFKKDVNGEVSRVSISNDKDQLRLARLKEADHA